MDSHHHYKFNQKKELGIVLASFSGGQRKPGVEDGPARLMEHGLQQQIHKLGWKTSVEDPLFGQLFEKQKSEDASDFHGKTKRPRLVGEATRLVYDSAKKIADRGGFVLTLGGDHSVSMGSVSAVLSKYPDAGLLWIDAHADINTASTTYSGNLHGCPISFLMGMDKENCPPDLHWVPKCLRANKLAYIGLRDVDEAERKIIKANSIAAFSMYHIDRFGINKVVEMAMEAVSPGGKYPIMVSYDVDAIDPAFVPATGTPVSGGLTLREGLFIAERVAETGNLVALDIVECNPKLADRASQVVETMSAGCAVARCALGETLL